MCYGFQPWMCDHGYPSSVLDVWWFSVVHCSVQSLKLGETAAFRHALIKHRSEPQKGTIKHPYIHVYTYIYIYVMCIIYAMTSWYFHNKASLFRINFPPFWPVSNALFVAQVSRLLFITPWVVTKTGWRNPQNNHGTGALFLIIYH